MSDQSSSITDRIFSIARTQPGWFTKGVAYEKRDRIVDATGAYMKAMDIDAKTLEGVDAALRLGILHYNKSAYTEARKFLEKAAERSTEERLMEIKALSYLYIGKITMAENKPDEAARIFMGIAVLYNNPEVVPESLYLASEAFKLTRKPLERRRMITELIERYPDSEWRKKIK